MGRKVFAGICLEDTMVSIIRKSEMVRTHNEYDDRLLRTHPDRCYRFILEMLRKVVVEERQRKNK